MIVKYNKTEVFQNLTKLLDIISTSLSFLRSRDVVWLAQGQISLSILLFMCHAMERQSSMVAKGVGSGPRQPEFESQLYPCECAQATSGVCEEDKVC